MNIRNGIIILSSIVAAVVTIIFASSIASPIYQNFRSDGFDNDPQYFLYIGRLMAEGQKPYIDIYDHKGLYIFYYYYLVNFLGGKIGLFVLELALYAVFYYFFIKTVSLVFENHIKTSIILHSQNMYALAPREIRIKYSIPQARCKRNKNEETSMYGGGRLLPVVSVFFFSFR